MSLLSSVLGRIIDIARGTHVARCAKQLRQSQWWEAHQIRELQMQKLAKLLRHAYENIPYYQKAFRSNNIVPDDIRCVEDIRLLPILRKENIRREFSVLKATSPTKLGTSVHQTNGSTGIPLTFMKDGSTKSISIAAQERSWGWAGYVLGDTIATIWGNQNYIAECRSIKKRIKHRLSKEVLFPACYLTSPQEYKNCIDRLVSLKPHIVFGYTQTLFLLAKYIKQFMVSTIRPRAVITTAEVLLASQREMIESQFGCKVFDQYGCGEIESIAYECEAHDGYHVVDEHVIVEVIGKDGKSVNTGETGSLIITDLDNYVMPFIRYMNGDSAVLSDQSQCSCGRNLSRLVRIMGREADVIFTPDGRILSLPSFYGQGVLDKVKGVAQFQVVQERKDALTIRVVGNEQFDANELRLLVDLTASYVGKEMFVQVERVHEISCEANGKYKLVKSTVDTGIS
jgi:phenylacetate-CoA ligase